MRFINFLLSVGSVDGVCTSAAVLRNADEGAEVAFCQAFTVDKVNPAGWGDELNVLLVDLAVNNRDESMTVDLLRRIHDAGHRVVGVLDEHNAEDWQRVFEAAGLSFEELTIKPVSQETGDIKSSGALLLSVLGDEADEQTRELCQAADAGDRMDFTTHFGGIVNQAVKSAIADDSRRVYLASHLAFNREADEKIRGWMDEYRAILANHDEIVAGKVDLGNGIHRVVATGKQVDMTTLMSRLYKEGAKVVVLEGEAYNKALGRKTLQISFGTSDRELDLLSTIKELVPSASGFAQKANVEPIDEEEALAAVRQTLYNRSGG